MKKKDHDNDLHTWILVVLFVLYLAIAIVAIFDMVLS
jgi:hypothetical protein